eukprot:CAMPEP_0197726788 /NCGR_PEP_ID=MMETSP1434-20131217/17139_1 /TAXON_ID=265543 /ORGANISM="Minutocellus polymorphus, Strain CCMP3303" /LENGTH=173 /DNA_ID=CAMNT_0043312813 /DNA_START=114 /DNA_END=635 /DNA_ORIENTATION=+
MRLAIGRLRAHRNRNNARRTRQWLFVYVHQPFHEGQQCEATYELLASSAGGTMILSEDNNGEIARETFDTAQRARDSVFGDPLKSFSSTLQKLMEVSEASPSPLKYDSYLNVALGGPPFFPPYGRIIPCKASAQTNDFPTFDCTCDVALVTQDVAASKLISKNKSKHTKRRKT